MITQADIALAIALDLIRKSGVREWEDAQARESISLAAAEMAANIWALSEQLMALPDSFVNTVGTAIIFADSTDHSPAAANNLGTRTNQIDLTSVANNAARQSDKVDLGENRAACYKVHAAIEIAATPTAGNVIEFWWAPSHSGTAGTGNPGGVGGADAAYAGYSSNLDASVKQLQFIGDFVCTAQATGTIQQGFVGYLFPADRYGTLVVVNRSGAALHSDAVEMSVALVPVQGKVID